MPERWFYVNAAGETIGPVTSKALKQLAENGIILPTTILVSEDGTQEFEAGRSKLFDGRKLSEETSQTRSLTPIPKGKTLPLAPAQQTAKTSLPAPPAPEMPMAPPPAFSGGIPMPTTMFSEGETIIRPKHGNWLDHALIFTILGVGVLFLLGACLVSFTWRMAVQHTTEMESQLPKYDISTTTGKSVRTVSRNPEAGGQPEDVAAEKPTIMEEITARAEKSIAQIDGPVSCGTGFVVAPGIVVTNSHIIASEKIESVSVLFPAQPDPARGPHKVRLLYEDTVRDIALLGIDETTIPALPIHDAYLFRRAQQILTIGNPGRGDGVVLENAVSAGILSTQTKVDGLPFYQLSIAVNAGNSGGPVLDEEGRVIGIITLKSAKGLAMAYCIPAEDLAHAIELEKNLTEKVRKDMNNAHLAEVGIRQGLERMGQESVFGNSPRSEAIGGDPRYPGDGGNALEESNQWRNESDNRNDTQGMWAEPDGPRMSDEEREKLAAKQHEERYQRIVNKEKWTFNGVPLYGKIVGFQNGIVLIHLRDAAENEPPLERYARRFSPGDINDILFYARYHGIPTGNLGRR